jgi:hypothetical protein
MKSEACPICLEDCDEANAFYWPTCGHKVHSICALTAAQYDVRCPMCRNLDENIKLRKTDDEQENENSDSDDDSDNFLETVERLIIEHERNTRNYKSKRYRVIRGDEKLSRLQTKLHEVEKVFKTSDKTLDREWMIHQKTMWNSNKKIMALRKDRKTCLRKVNYFSKKLECAIENKIGSPPEPPELNLT